MTAATLTDEAVRYTGAAAVAALQVLTVVLSNSTDNRADRFLTDDQRVIRRTAQHLERTTRRLMRHTDGVIVPAPLPPSDHHVERLFALHDRVIRAVARESEVDSWSL